jgi:aerobic C4-dicarboxylate transport protein
MAPSVWLKSLYVQVLLGALLGIGVGVVWPGFGVELKPFGDGFVKLVKMGIAPVVFCTVVHGVGSVVDLKRLGRVGGRTLVYFEVVSTLALGVGLCVVNLLQPGQGFHVDPGTLDPAKVSAYAGAAKKLGISEYLLNVIPNTFWDAFGKGDLLQVLLVSVLSAVALQGMGATGQRIVAGVKQGGDFFFRILSLVVKLAPVGAFGAMAFTVGAYGVSSLNRLLKLLGGFYLTSALFVVVVLGVIAWRAGFSVFRLVRYLREELLLVLGTSSSETALPGLMRKLERLGCSPATVGLVVPTGYSFNLDGTNIYMTMAAVFLAQAMDIPLGLREQVALLLVAMVASKGASGVTGAGFVALAATLQAVPGIPVEGMALLVGVDRFMSECRALTNLVGNAVATVVVSRWEGELDGADLRRRLLNDGGEEAGSPGYEVG